MIPQVRGFQGCYLDNHRNNWRCARAVRPLCESAPIQWMTLTTLHLPPSSHKATELEISSAAGQGVIKGGD